MTRATTHHLSLIDLHPESESFEKAVLEGFTQPRKKISPKFLYDQRGSELFDQICDCADYYVTRTEISILQENAAEMAEALGERPLLIEFGSGASRKTRILLDHISEPAAYVPIDISRDFLLESSEALLRDYPQLRLLPVCADFTRPLLLPHESLPHDVGRRTAFFPGSTIGNFDRTDAAAFLRQTAQMLGPRGMLLIGVDLIKDKALLEPAYDDSQGVTAAFNLNLLVRIRSELGSNIDPAAFSHKAFFNQAEGRVEMHLVSLKDQTAEILGQSIHFNQGETIHTESSYKYEPQQFEAMAEQSGFTLKRQWTDPRGFFMVYLLEVNLSAEAIRAA